MPQYIKDIPEYVPQIQPWQPNLQLYQNALLRRQKQYDTNFDKVNSLYGSLFNSDLTRPSDIQMRDEFLKLADFEIKRLSSVDLSNQQNLRAATDLFKPLYENENFIHDVSYTKKLKSSYGQADALKRCTDPEKCDGMYWDGGVQHLNYQAQDYANSTDEEALSMRAPSYVPAQNLAKDATKLLKDAGFETKVVTFEGNKGQYIFTTENGEALKAPLTSYLNSVFANDPKYTSYYNVKADLQKRNWLGENEKYFATPEEAESKYAMNALNALYDIYDEQDLQINRVSNEVDQELSLFEKYLKNHESPNNNLKTERVAQLQSEKQVVEAEKQRLVKVNYLLTNGIDINDINTYKDRINSIVAQELLQTEINGFAKSWQEGRVKQEVKINQFAKSGYDHELALNRMERQHDLDIIKMIAKNKLEGGKNKKLTKEEKAKIAYEDRVNKIRTNNSINQKLNKKPLADQGKELITLVEEVSNDEGEKIKYYTKNYPQLFIDNISQNSDLYKLTAPGLYDILGITDPDTINTMGPSALKEMISALPDNAGEGKPSIQMVNSYIDGLINNYHDYQPDLNSPEAKNAGLYPNMLDDKAKEAWNNTEYNLSSVRREMAKSNNKIIKVNKQTQTAIDKNIDIFYKGEKDGKKYDGDYETMHNLYPKKDELSVEQINSMLIDFKAPVGSTLKTEDEFIKDYLYLVKKGQVTGIQGGGTGFYKEFGDEVTKYWTSGSTLMGIPKKLKKDWKDIATYHAVDIYKSASNGFFEFAAQHVPRFDGIDTKGGNELTAKTTLMNINTKFDDSPANEEVFQIADIIKNNPNIETIIEGDISSNDSKKSAISDLVLDDLTDNNSKGYDFKVEFNPLFPLDEGTDADPDYSYFKVTPSLDFVKKHSGTENLQGATYDWSEYNKGIIYKVPKDQIEDVDLYVSKEDRIDQNLLNEIKITEFSNTSGTTFANVVEENGQRYLVVKGTVLTNKIIKDKNGDDMLTDVSVPYSHSELIDEDYNADEMFNNLWAILQENESYNISVINDYNNSIKK